MNKVFRMYISFILIIFCFAGCCKESVSTNEVTIYINGEAVNITEIEQYIDISKLYWKSVFEIGNEPNVNTDTENVDNEALDLMFKIYYHKAEVYMNYNDDDWKKEYIKSEIVKDELYSKTEVMKDEIATMVDVYVQEILDTGKLTYLDNSKLDMSEILNKLATKYDLLYKSCVDLILRPFYERISADEIFLYYFADNGYIGKKIEWDGTNLGEFEAYLNDLYRQYDEYKVKLLEQADIVEKSK